MCWTKEDNLYIFSWFILYSQRGKQNKIEQLLEARSKEIAEEKVRY